MRLELRPRPDPVVTHAVLAAIAESDVVSAEQPLAYRSPWRVTALAEAADRQPESDVSATYAPSPRSSRGAARA